MGRGGIGGSAELVGCLQTKSEVEVKPVDINLNITGRLELVITDARRQEEEITGAKPKRTVRPEDIGLPPVAGPKSEATGPGTKLLTEAPASGSCWWQASMRQIASSDRQGQLIQQMAARHPQIEALLDQSGGRRKPHRCPCAQGKPLAQSAGTRQCRECRPHGTLQVGSGEEKDGGG